MRTRWLTLTAILLIGALWAAPCLAADETTPAASYHAILTPLNGSGVSAEMFFKVEGDKMTFQVEASGLEPGKAHGMQIRGFSGVTQDAYIPPASAAGTDGVLTLDEAMPYVGADRLL